MRRIKRSSHLIRVKENIIERGFSLLSQWLLAIDADPILDGLIALEKGLRYKSKGPKRQKLRSMWANVRLAWRTESFLKTTLKRKVSLSFLGKIIFFIDGSRIRCLKKKTYIL
ncbi:hypothetical protein TNIN_500891 [Trichonephila inaurata madagascariensis]|uniref:Uncharacterized protein n=1 Tax=Trichonephila inaurata madagascariensis TaxID=2747483 RepID=A0A8X6YT73_9ARAC|nr:hypothetical protein TNIN_500891 [Trichonephila inaurata madagascariensis]